LYARATQGLYPPGSTFKILTALAYYRSTKDPYAYEFTCTGSVTIGNSILHCSHGLVHGTQTIREAFAKSCNCFFAELGVSLGGERLQETAESVHLTETFSFDLPQSTSSVTLNASSTPNMLAETAMGQGETVITPFQLNMLTAAIANQGVLYQPYLIDRVIDSDGNVAKKFYPTWYGSLMTTEEAAYLEDLMAGVITIGTAPSLADDRWQVWGKTGTAQVGEDIQDHSWFTGFADIGDQPRIAVTVLIENAGDTMRAVPITRKVLEYFAQ
jgi:peptidoglycan glycosyltransferase